MQKKIIALAVAALASTAALAQSNVTVYGIADASETIVGSNSQGTTVAGGAVQAPGQRAVARLDSNSSYIGFKGVEDLGNGVKALFQFETAFAIDKGYFSSTATTGRDSYVGLTGGFGTVVAGNLTHPLRAFGAKAELLPAAAGLGTMAAVTGQVATRLGTVQTGADDRAQNAVAYVSPSFAGFTGIFAYVNGENRVSETVAVRTVDQKAWQVAGQYDNGPLFVGLGYHKVYDGAFITPAAVLPVVDQQNASVVRGVVSYTLPSATKLVGLYDRTKVINIAGIHGGDVHRTAWSLGVSQGFGKNTVGLEYAHSGNLKTEGLGALDIGSNTNVHELTAVYTYDLSKRTSVVARFSKLTNASGASSNFYAANNPVANGGVTGYGTDFTGYALGLRHAF